jgi:hypothetical protein
VHAWAHIRRLQALLYAGEFLALLFEFALACARLGLPVVLE